MSISDEQPAILFHGVWKSFNRHTGPMLIRDRLKQLLHPRAHEMFHALRDITFLIHQGESMAVIGHNGAGKSTLLNLATNLCRPDQGSVEVNGRVAALLELGSGFHPDLTGAENVRINAALLGFSRRQVREKFDEIIAFSELGGFHQRTATHLFHGHDDAVGILRGSERESRHSDYRRSARGRRSVFSGQMFGTDYAIPAGRQNDAVRVALE